MSKELPQPQQSEEVDLGQLFKLIGNAFDRLFKFIGSVFIGIYKLILILMLHFYKRFIWYVGAVFLGLVIGVILDRKSDQLYGANMYIETNFDSARQVYENIRQFHQLAKIDKDTLQLAEYLKISPNEAAKLKGFYVQPDVDENYIMELYSKFYNSLDSISQLTMVYDDYKKSLNSYNYKTHIIGVASTDKFIYKKIQDVFVKEISDNEYLKELAKVNQQILKKRDTVLLQQVQKTDSLASQYLKIRINESNKTPLSGAGTNLYMGNAEQNSLIVDESKILQQRLRYEDQRREIDSALVKQQNIVNVVSGFPSTGYDITEWHEKKTYILPMLLFSITLVVFGLKDLGNYLKHQQTHLNYRK
ncbi:hypothetical protein [Changchengzhania lutea]|uniref:hypothetical protein n=1 Tax=Changchengzhania lutea TaxID=2049305 RepID=UPI00115CF9E3|nr:hypothetical protein [Changchengzhania lutea]